MGMHTYAIGIRDLDGEFKRMMDMKQVCDSNAFSYPKELEAYFGDLIIESDEYICEQMMTVNLPKGTIKESQDDSRQFFDLEVKDIPKGVKTIRFVNSY